MQLQETDGGVRARPGGGTPMAHSHPHWDQVSHPYWDQVSPKVKDGVGDGWGPVIKGLDDDGETCRGQ